MNAPELRLSYKPDDEWVGELTAVVKSGAFSGKGSAWFDRKSLKESFVLAMRAFPLSAGDPPVIEGGFWSKEETLEQCHLRVAVRPYDRRGKLLVQVDLASPSRTTPDSDQQQLVTARFLTEYSALDKFASSLEQVLDGKSESAVLPGTEE